MAGMKMYKICLNHLELSPDSDRDYNFANQMETLGVHWKPIQDYFLFRVKVFSNDSYAKQDVLFTIAKLFDPLWLVGPVVSKAKIFMQKLWRFKIDWSDPLPAEEYWEWHKFLKSLESINDIKISRRIITQISDAIKFHGFSDAAKICYGAVVYCKSVNSSGKTLVSLPISKSRIAPLKSLTILRLEFCATTPESKPVKRVIAALKLEEIKVYLWTDSMIILSWIQREPMDLKTFVQNRVAKIQDWLPTQNWQYVSSHQSPSDLISWGVDPDKLLNRELWWNGGPTFLSGNDYQNKTITTSKTHNAHVSELRICASERTKNSLPVFFTNNEQCFVDILLFTVTII